MNGLDVSRGPDEWRRRWGALNGGDAPIEAWLAADVQRFERLLPMDREQYLGFLAAIQGSYSFRGLASLAGALLGVDYSDCLNDTYLVASDMSPVSDQALAEMRARVLELGWVPDPEG
ncbi:hypothetical protein [Kineosporia sp. A_224]|uniref:hypothetical protein n=1 Tax=Kineosporia sp. A_224 TaxID=1962180 RepID=UPI000B4AA303|nr:hypothetical protein [Kineosporia sp. A_224]